MPEKAENQQQQSDARPIKPLFCPVEVRDLELSNISAQDLQLVLDAVKAAIEVFDTSRETVSGQSYRCRLEIRVSNSRYF